jgi:hypothetical protein
MMDMHMHNHNDDDMKNPKMQMNPMGSLPYFDQKMKPQPHQDMMMYPGVHKNFFGQMGGMPYPMPNMFMPPYMPRNVPMQPQMFPGGKLQNPKKMIADMAKTVTNQMKEKDSVKVPKKENEDSTRILNISPPPALAEIFKSLQISLKNGQELLFYNICKKILTDIENRAKDKKLKNLQKEISDFLLVLHDKLKQDLTYDKKDKKKATVSTASESKISDYDLLRILHEKNDPKTVFSIFNLEKSKIDIAYPSNILEIKETDESKNLFEEATRAFKTNQKRAALEKL